ncbi:MAG: serpin family protein [Lachnospiraceae bacterium]|nr:serpin family protein [Lachnospiraceae bacterium]
MKKKIIAAIMAGMMIAGCGASGSSEGGSAGGTSESRTSGNTVNVTENAELINVSYSEDDLKEEWIGSLSGSSMNLFNGVLEKEGEGQNICISPTSMMMAFGMLENGAGGETLSQIENVMNGGISVEQMNPIMYAMAEHFESSEDVKWNVANSIWFRNDGKFEILPEFASAAKSWYDAEIMMAQFDGQTVKDVNSWVERETRGMITEIINGFSEQNRMLLVNAVAFEGKWMNEYEKSDIFEDCKFTNYNGSTSDVTMLKSFESSYIELGNGVGFIRPYKGGEYSFVGILPDEGVSVNDYISGLAQSGEDFSEAFRNPRYYDGDIIVSMPEFTNEYNVTMNDVLENMGMTAPFSSSEADFYGVMKPTGDDPYQVWISSVIHKTFIEVDREGTRAAAVTAITLDTCNAIEVSNPPMYITLDRPFVYAIVDNETGLPVFLGCVNQL